MEIDIKVLDNIIKETVAVIESSKEQIYHIAESALLECQRVEAEINQIKNQVAVVIKQVSQLEVAERKARIRLMEVSKDFHRFAENDIKEAYEQAQLIQLKLVMLREEEKTLRFKRDHLELSLKRMRDTAERAEKLVSQVGMALQFLSNDLSGLSQKLGNLHDMQQLGISIIRAQEEERKRVAREIHDGPAQSMANIVMRAEFCLKLLEINPGLVRGELLSLQQLVRQSLQDVRKIIFDLRPMVLDDLGLVPAIKRYLEDYKTQNNMQVEFVLMGKEQRFDTSLEVAAFRIIQEALTNVKKHAHARHVVIKMELIPKRINVYIKDDGCGFCMETQKPRRDGSGGYGLLGMKERIQLLKGGLTISSAPGKGTEVNFWLPLNDLS
ncbi:sensor histidine kinase [Desulforamulus hydrothermalis]|uniref:Oxygen sensor histidine kinase NreB n=1 Tax=Desulforamulus hydrothermalis Lam5 = DSM 18033 TaxID=1121428 RepID=K8E6D2_9FIRM|nr:sensor histidine kinase [Desulforamulus hydrothermalis]CCO07033.1 Sensor protein degS [Desulforamulus hydrothermalis Lam5 = DSM 18033]SHG97153.1 two-component system, NarL family, sensor histidine kinase DegS [Desulforamulus hydrothermalis Lam5 = DSM 18033]